MKTFTKSLLALVLLLSYAPFASAQIARYVEGTHYNAIQEPLRTSDPNKIEVMELFWYGCGHCYAFEPLIDSWQREIPSDVVFVRSPGMWNDMMKTHAQIFYTEMELGVFDKLHSVVFNEIQEKRNYLETQDQVREVFVANGVAAADFDKAWTSFTVTSAVRQADTRMRASGAGGVPGLIVNGKYLVSTDEAVPTHADMLKVVDFLIAKERGS